MISTGLDRLVSALSVLMALLTAAAVKAETIVVKGFDSAAIAAAIERSQEGDTVKLPAGIYRITEAVKPKSKTRLIGSGEDKTVLLFTGDKPDVIVNLSNCDDVEICGFTLDGANSVNAHQGIFATNARRLNIHHVTIRNLVKSEAFGPHGILFTGIGPTRENGVTDSIISDCTFENIGVDSQWGAGIRLAWGSSRNSVLRNVISGTGRGGILCDNGSTDLVIRENVIAGSGGEGLGIEVWGGCDRAVIEDNRIDHWLSIGGCNFCAVRRNIISDKSGIYKFLGIEGIGSYLVITDNVVDDGQQIGISVSGNVPKNYVFWGYNTIRNCIQWGAQLQGEEAGIAYHYFYRCKFLSTSVGRGNPPWPGDEGHGFRTNGNTRYITLEECEFSDNGRYGVQLGGANVDFLSFLRCVIRGNKGAAVVGPGSYTASAKLGDYTALEWIDCTIEGNGDNSLPPPKPFSYPPPTASFDAPSSVRVGEQVKFVSKSRAAKGKIAAVLWDFGDGVPDTKARTTYTYHRPGTYRVTLIVWDEWGRSSRVEKKIKVR